MEAVHAFSLPEKRSLSVKLNLMDDKKQYQEELHVGRLIKSELIRQGRNITWLSTQVNCSRENLYKVFRRPWIYTDLLFEICKALDYDFFNECSEFYKRHKDAEI